MDCLPYYELRPTPSLVLGTKFNFGEIPVHSNVCLDLRGCSLWVSLFPKANVVASNRATGVKYSSVTNGNGEYPFSQRDRHSKKCWMLVAQQLNRY
jgi:hypothetical protein